MTKDDLIAELDRLIETIRTRSSSAITLILLPASLEKKVTDLAGQCIDLRKEIHEAADDPSVLLDFRKRILDLEAWVRRRIAKNNTFPSVMLVYGGGVLFFLILTSVDIAGWIKRTLGVETPERLITLGIAGALVYLATYTLASIEQANVDSSIRTVITFSIRLFLAVVVPIVLVVLFFKSDGTITEIALTPEVLSFVSGYSAKLVIDLFNKVVEKVSKMIESL